MGFVSERVGALHGRVLFFVGGSGGKGGVVFLKKLFKSGRSRFLW
jgi:hypothetical protein